MEHYCAVMKWMGWSWPDLLAAPAYMVNVTIPRAIRRESERAGG